MKSLIALVVAGLLIVWMFAYAKSIRQQFLSQFRQSLRDAYEAGEMPSEISEADIARATPEGFDTELDADMMSLLLRADLIEGFWIVWIPVLVSICLLVARLIPVGTRFVPDAP